MKYILVIGDGMADNGVPELEGLTPLEHLSKTGEIPNIDRLSREGVLGRAKNCPDGLPPGSDTAILSIFGCDPEKYYTGRAPLEAAASGISLKPGDIAYRCNMVSLTAAENGPDTAYDDMTIVSHSAGSIDGQLSDSLVRGLFSDPIFSGAADRAGMRVHPSGSFRHIAVQEGASAENLILSPPHNYLGSVIRDLLPSGSRNAEVLKELQKLSYNYLSRHEINIRRIADDRLPANSIWFWAEGTAVKLPGFAQHYGISGGVISAVPLCSGIARLTGLNPISVEGATGELDTNYEGKVDAVIEVLKELPFAAVHVEAPDECTHNGDLEGKLEAIRRLDKLVVGPICDRLNSSHTDFRMLILSDHKTLTSTRGHDGDPVPYLIFDSRKQSGCGLSYTETAAAGTPVVKGTELLDLLFEKTR